MHFGSPLDPSQTAAAKAKPRCVYLILKLSTIRTSALPRQQQSNWGLRVTQNVYFSLMTLTKQLLLVTFCYTTAGIEASFQTHAYACTEEEGHTDVEVEIVI